MSVGPSPRRARAAASRDRVVDGQHVVAVADDTRHAVADGRGRRGSRRRTAPVRRGQPVLVVLDDEHHRQLPDRREVEGFVEVPLARGAIAREGARPRGLRRAAAPRARARWRPAASRPRWLIMPTMRCSSEPKWNVRSRPLVKPPSLNSSWWNSRTTSTLRVVNTPRLRCIGRMKSSGSSASVTPTAMASWPMPGEPLRELALPEQAQHLVLDQARQDQRACRSRSRSGTPAGRVAGAGRAGSVAWWRSCSSILYRRVAALREPWRTCYLTGPGGVPIRWCACREAASDRDRAQAARAPPVTAWLHQHELLLWWLHSRGPWPGVSVFMWLGSRNFTWLRVAFVYFAVIWA